MPSGKVFGNEKHDWSIRRNLAQKQKLLKTFHSCSSDHPFPNEFFVFFRRLQDFGKKCLFQRIMTHKSELRSVAHRLPARVSVNSTAIWEEKRRHSPTGKWEVIVKPPPAPPAAAFSEMQLWNTTAADSVTRRVVARVHSSKQSQSICQLAA